MRTWTIISHGETTAELEAERAELIEQGVVTFWSGTSLVGLVRDWHTITSDTGPESQPIDRAQIREKVADAMSGVPVRAHQCEGGDMPELPDPFDAFPEDHVVNPEPLSPPPMPPEVAAQADAARKALDEADAGPLVRGTVSDDGPPPMTKPPAAPPAERTDLDHDIEELLVLSGARDPLEGPVEDAVGDHEEDIIAGRIPPDEDETSEPDAPGVSTDPIPEPEPALALDDVDATPPEPSPSESTDDDDPSADGEGSDMDQLAIRISGFFVDHRKQPILDEFIAWAGQNGIPVQPNRMTLKHRRAVVAWFENGGKP